jgi:hypothetical protein
LANSQPWRWVFEHGTLHLFADHGRIGHHTDITGNEVVLSCGAALHHLEVTAAAAGWATGIDRFPDPQDDDLLASITFRAAESVSEHTRALADAIAQRRTDRLAFAAPEPWSELDHILRASLKGTAVTVDVIDDSGRPALADASRRTEEHRRDDASYRYELLWWTHHSDSEDGVPPSALASSAEASRVDVSRDFPAYGTDDRRPEVTRDQSKILVLSTFDDSHENILRCGEALSRVLLECTVAGVATCTLTHMIEVHASREAVRRLIGRRAEPQVLIRVGRAVGAPPAAAHTARRPIADVLAVR